MDKQYKIFYIPKAKGYRKIVTYASPDSELYRFHSNALQSMERHFRHSKFAKAYIKHRSIITNAKAHLYNDIFVCLDIHDFFKVSTTTGLFLFSIMRSISPPTSSSPRNNVKT